MAPAFASVGHLQDVGVGTSSRLLPILHGCGQQCSSPRGFWLWILLMLKITGCLVSQARRSVWGPLEEPQQGTPLYLLGKTGGKLVVGKLLQIINFKNKQPSLCPTTPKGLFCFN